MLGLGFRIRVQGVGFGREQYKLENGVRSFHVWSFSDRTARSGMQAGRQV